MLFIVLIDKLAPFFADDVSVHRALDAFKTNFELSPVKFVVIEFISITLHNNVGPEFSCVVPSTKGHVLAVPICVPYTLLEYDSYVVNDNSSSFVLLFDGIRPSRVDLFTDVIVIDLFVVVAVPVRLSNSRTTVSPFLISNLWPY